MSQTIIQLRRHVAWRWPLCALRAATAAGLAIDAYVHLDLASQYAESGGTINEGILFRAEAAVAVLAAIAVVVSGRLASYLAGLVVAGSALTVMLVSRYVNLGPIGPIPSTYDPVWYPEKLLAAFAEGAATATALVGIIIVASRARKARRTLDLRGSGRQLSAMIRQEEHQHDDRTYPHSTGPSGRQAVPKCPSPALPPPTRGRRCRGRGGCTAGRRLFQRQHDPGLRRRGRRPGGNRRGRREPERGRQRDLALYRSGIRCGNRADQ